MQLEWREVPIPGHLALATVAYLNGLLFAVIDQAMDEGQVWFVAFLTSNPRRDICKAENVDGAKFHVMAAAYAAMVGM